MKFSAQTLRLFDQLLTTTPLSNAPLDNDGFEESVTQIVTARRELRDALAEVDADHP